MSSVGLAQVVERWKLTKLEREKVFRLSEGCALLGEVSLPEGHVDEVHVYATASGSWARQHGINEFLSGDRIDTILLSGSCDVHGRFTLEGAQPGSSYALGAASGGWLTAGLQETVCGRDSQLEPRYLYALDLHFVASGNDLRGNDLFTGSPRWDLEGDWPARPWPRTVAGRPAWRCGVPASVPPRRGLAFSSHLPSSAVH